MPHPFDEATAIEALGDGEYRATMDRSWWVAVGPHGGYVAAIVLRALSEAVGDPSRQPRSFTVHYPAPPREGDVQIATRVERSGRSLSTVTARVTQEERVVALATAAFSAPREEVPLPAGISMPEVPGPEGLDPSEGADRRPPFARHFDMRRCIGGAPFGGGDQAVAGGWIRLAEPRQLDHLLVATLMDAWYPPAFPALDRPAIVPTIDLTIHFRAELPLPGTGREDFWLGEFRSLHSAQGFVDEEGELWSADGRLIAQARQLALLLPVEG